MGKTRGFTVIELLITIVVLGILLSLAVPAFTDFINQQRVKKVAREFQAAVLQARSEAVKRNTSIYVTANSSWSGGWFVSTSAAATSCVAASCLGSYVDLGSINAAFSTAATQIELNKSGRPAGGSVTMTFCDSGTTAKIKKYEVEVQLSGFAAIEQAGACGS